MNGAQSVSQYRPGATTNAPTIKPDARMQFQFGTYLNHFMAVDTFRRGSAQLSALELVRWLVVKSNGLRCT